MSKKNNCFPIIFFFLICSIAIGSIIYNNSKSNEKISTENSYQAELSSNSSQVYDCSFTKTYILKDKLDDYPDNHDGTSFVVVEIFQTFEPIIVAIPSAIKQQLKLDTYYEFTYTLQGVGNIETMTEVEDYLINSLFQKYRNLSVSSSLNVSLDIQEIEPNGVAGKQEKICN